MSCSNEFDKQLSREADHLAHELGGNPAGVLARDWRSWKLEVDDQTLDPPPQTRWLGFFPGVFRVLDTRITQIVKSKKGTTTLND